MDVLKFRNDPSSPWHEIPALIGPTGPQGEPGEKGETGPAGQDGYTPVKGTDYWTAADQEEIVNDVLAALPSSEEVSY